MSVIFKNDANIFTTFVSYVKLGLQENIGEHEKTDIEKLGDGILWTVEKLPGKIYDLLANPKIITVALTTLGLYSNSLVFYSSQTVAWTKWAVSFIPCPPFWAVKFGSYLFVCALIIGAGCRAYGRFSNEELMTAFNKKTMIGHQ